MDGEGRSRGGKETDGGDEHKQLVYVGDIVYICEYVYMYVRVCSV